MNPTYTRMIATAKKLINKYGMNITFRKNVAGAPVVPGQEWKPTANTPMNQTVKVVFLPEETINLYFDVRILHTNDQEGFEYCIMPNNGITPSLDDIIIKNGVEEKIRYVHRYAPTDVTILYIIGLRF